MSVLGELERHSGHRLTFDGTRSQIRCVDCVQLVDVRGLVASRSGSLELLTKDQECPEHSGEWARRCRCCEANRKSGDDDQAAHRGPLIPMPPAIRGAWAAFRDHTRVPEH